MQIALAVASGVTVNCATNMQAMSPALIEYLNLGKVST
jgi:hypothetical protein